MSKIEKLIAQLCPNGVEHVSLDSLFTLRKGENLTNEQAVPGSYPVITASRGSALTHNDFNFSGEYITISSHGAYAGFVSYYNEKFWLGNNVFLFESNGKKVSTRFYFHVLKTLAHALLATVNTGGIPYINAKDLSRLRVPYPPIEIQCQIVEILDAFTEFEAELEAELEARKLQFEFYREGYFNFDRKISFLTLGSLCDIGDGLHGTPNYSDFGDYYFINGNNLRNGEIFLDDSTKRVDSTVYAKNGITFDELSTVFMSINGTVGNLALYRGQNIVLGKSVGYFKTNGEKLNAKYLFFLLQTNFAKTYFTRQLTGSTIRNLGLKALRNFEIPCPSLEEQENIVRRIENFEDLAVRELPAEIRARKQQFEYYRNRLLTFKELEFA